MFDILLYFIFCTAVVGVVGTLVASILFLFYILRSGCGRGRHSSGVHFVPRGGKHPAAEAELPGRAWPGDGADKTA